MSLSIARRLTGTDVKMMSFGGRLSSFKLRRPSEDFFNECCFMLQCFLQLLRKISSIKAAENMHSLILTS